MKKTILEIYALAVCFFTVICFVIAMGIAGYSLLAIAVPEFTINSMVYNQHLSNDAFWTGCNGPFCAPGEKTKERPSEPELTKQREAAYARVLSTERRDASQTFVKCLIVMLIDALVFGFHWVVARGARAAASAS